MEKFDFPQQFFVLMFVFLVGGINLLEKGLNTMVVTGGAQHSLVLTTEGLFSFGRNDSGQLGCTEEMSKDDWGAFEKYPMEVRIECLLSYLF